MVCLLGRPWDSVLSRPWNWPAYLPPLSGKRACLYGVKVYTDTRKRDREHYFQLE